METIHILRPNVSQEEAITCFRRRAIAATVHAFISGPLRSIAPFYIPFHLYRVEIDNRGTQQSQLLAIDAMTCAFDPYSFDPDFCAGNLVEVDTRNRPNIGISPEVGQGLVVEKVRRAIFRSGFFRVQELQIHATFVPLPLHIPYWVGFFGRGSSARIEVLDAVRRSFEGARVKTCVRDWLQS
jgi:hypothetical protein